MHAIHQDLVERCAAIIGTDGISDDVIEARVQALCGDPMLARRLIDWMPEAFGLVFLPHVANFGLPTTFSAKSRRGEWMQFPFEVEPIFPVAVRIGSAMYHSGSRSVFRNVVLRSAMVNAVNKALDRGEHLDGAVLTGPAMIGIPAETYLPRPAPLWRRLFC